MKRYYKVGISGHRDLVPSQMAAHYTTLEEHLLTLKKTYHDKELVVLTSLADGADRLIAQVALNLDIPYDVVLPMSIDLYQKDFSELSLKEFLFFLKRAHSSKVIKLFASNTPSRIAKPSIYRDYQYRQVGRTIVDMADEVVIMTDGIENYKIGGTNDIAKYAKRCDKIIYEIRCERLCA